MQPDTLSHLVSKSYIELKGITNSLNSPIIITSHKQADPDALGSAILLYSLLRMISSVDVTILLPTRSKQTEKIISNYNLENIIQEHVNDNYSVKDYCIILVDTNQPLITDLSSIFSQNDSKNIWESCKTRIILDHHLLTEETTDIETIKIIYPDYSSTSELAYDLLLESKIEIPSKNIIAVGLLGILFDTKRLILANAHTLRRVASMLEYLESSVEDYLVLLDNEKEHSERTANVKTAQRNKLVVLQEQYLLSLSFVSSYESSSARSLLYLGSDIVAVVNRGKKEIRISFRSTKNFFEDTGLHCGELANYMAEKYSGTGSGHPTAAGCNLAINNSNNELFDAITEYITKYLESRQKKD